MRRATRICGRHSFKHAWSRVVNDIDGSPRPIHCLSNLHKHVYPQTVSAICINMCMAELLLNIMVQIAETVQAGRRATRPYPVGNIK